MLCLDAGVLIRSLLGTGRASISLWHIPGLEIDHTAGIIIFCSSLHMFGVLPCEEHGGGSC